MTLNPLDGSFYKELLQALTGKVDKETGKGLSSEDFTSAEKSKLSGISAGATANDTDVNLKNRANHTGTQEISTVTELQSALTAITNRLDALEAWKTALKVTRLEVFTATTDSGGEVTITTSTTFTNPKVVACVSAADGAEGYHTYVIGVSGANITLQVFKNKTQGVLLGGTIDPDNPVTSGVSVHILVAEST